MSIAELPPVPVGWFADQVIATPDHPDWTRDGEWVAVFQHSFGLAALEGMTFRTEAECNAFIAANLLGASWLDARPPLGVVTS